MFLWHCGQCFLEVALLDIKQSNHGLIGAVCVVCMCIWTHSSAEYRSVESFSPLQPSNILLLNLHLIETTFGSESPVSLLTLCIHACFHQLLSFPLLTLDNQSLFLSTISFLIFQWLLLLSSENLSISIQTADGSHASTQPLPNVYAATVGHDKISSGLCILSQIFPTLPSPVLLSCPWTANPTNQVKKHTR